MVKTTQNNRRQQNPPILRCAGCGAALEQKKRARPKPCPPEKCFVVLVGWIHLDLGHHATILMVENVAVVDKCPGNIRIAEIQAASDTRVRAAARPGRDGETIVEFRILHRHTIDRHQQEVDLMNMEIVGLACTVFDGPIFNGPNRGGNCRRIVHVEDFRLGASHRDEVLGRSVAAHRLLGEIEVPGSRRLGRQQAGKSRAIHRRLGRRPRRRRLHLRRCPCQTSSSAAAVDWDYLPHPWRSRWSGRCLPDWMADRAR